MKTKEKYNLIDEIKQPVVKRLLSKAYYVLFDKGKELLESKGYHIPSLKENAELRIQEGKNAYCSQNANWTRERGIYVPKKGIFLTKKSPIMKNAQKATEAHGNGKEYYLNDKQVESALEGAFKFSKNQKSVPTNRFAEDELTVYAFEDAAESYGEFLLDAGIKRMPIWLRRIEDKPFVRQVLFDRVGNSSGLDINCRLYHYGGVRGVKKGD